MREWPARQKDTREEPCLEAEGGQLCRKRLGMEPKVTERSGRIRLGKHLLDLAVREFCDGCYRNGWVEVGVRTWWPIE